MSAEADELRLYIDNDEPLYRQKRAAMQNLALKKARGVYDTARAPKIFEYVAEAGAKKYWREFGAPGSGSKSSGSWHQIFSSEDRREVAREMAREFETEWNTPGDREYFIEKLPKKYKEKIALEEVVRLAHVGSPSQAGDLSGTMGAAKAVARARKYGISESKIAKAQGKGKASRRRFGELPSAPAGKEYGFTRAEVDAAMKKKHESGGNPRTSHHPRPRAGGVHKAVRYSGSVKVTLSYNDSRNQYNVSLAAPGKMTAQVRVGRPASTHLTADSAEAFDDAARAALNLFGEEYPDIVEVASMSENGYSWEILRKRPSARRHESGGNPRVSRRRRSPKGRKKRAGGKRRKRRAGGGESLGRVERASLQSRMERALGRSR